MNFNNLKPIFRRDNTYPDYKRRTSVYAKDNISIVFDNLESFVCDKIKEADAVTGCVAWLTNEKIIDAMSIKKCCQIIVQKEDFLRPDKYCYNKIQYYEQYMKIKGLNWSDIGLSVDAFVEINGIRCVGMCKDKKNNPRMHHKFIILYKENPKKKNNDYNIIDDGYEYLPYAILTGSFNYTHNGTNSFENIVYIEDEEIATIYKQEYEHILLLSEELDWKSEFVDLQCLLPRS